MKPEQKRIKIAEACGWTQINPRETQWEAEPTGVAPHRTRSIQEIIPDYLNDLNACHEMENVLGPKGKWETYEKEVVSLTHGWGQAIHATSAQRAEAFLRTLNLWEDEQ